MLERRLPLLLLAAAGRTGGGAGLRRRARALPSADPRPLAPVLAPRRGGPPGLARAGRVAAHALLRARGVPSAGLGRPPRTVSEVEIRDASPADAPAIASIYNEGVRERVATFQTREHDA